MGKEGSKSKRPRLWQPLRVVDFIALHRGDED